MIKSNPVVFPYKPFHDLNNVAVRDNFVLNLHFSLKELGRALDDNSLASIKPRGKNTEEKILSVFLHPDLRFGPSSLITKCRSFWLGKFSYFTGRKKPLKLAILGFPGKAPVPLKTNRTLPDFGEVLALKRLRDLCLKIKETYSPGAVAYAITEGVLGETIGISSKESRAYERQLAKLTKLLGWNKYIKFIPLGELKKEVNFKRLFRVQVTKLNELLKNGDKETVKRYKLAYPSVFHLLNTRGQDLKILSEVYSGKPRSAEAKRCRNLLEKKVRQAICRYFALLAVRDEVNFLEKKVPRYIALTVSPKPYRLGIHLIHRQVDILAHHGVPVGRKIQYLIDVRRSPKRFARIYLNEDGEKLPFLYLPLHNL